MLKNKMRKVTYIIPLLALMQLFSLIQYRETQRINACTTTSECNNEIENAKKKRAALQEEQKKLEAQSADIQTQLANVVRQLEAYQEEATAITIELAQLKDQQVKLKAGIAENDKKIRKRLLDTQLSLETNVSLQFIANSSSITELIERLQAVHDLSQSDRNLIKTLSEQVKVLEENEKKQKIRQADLETSMKEAEKLRESKQADLDKYATEVQAKLNEQKNETNKIKLSENQINEIEEANKRAEELKRQEAAARAAKAHASKPSEAAPVPTVPIKGNGTPSQNEKNAFQYFVSRGYTREAAAGIIGNFYVESGMDPTKRQYFGGPGRGLAQWGFNMDGGRFNDLIDWARAQNRSEWSLDTQLDWTIYELQTYGSFRELNRALKSSHDVGYTTYYFGKIFEAPARLSASIGERTAKANQVLSRN